MIEVTSGRYRCCDGMTRRSVLKAGILSFGGFGLADWLRLKARADAAGTSIADLSVILIWQGGGPSHLDMWDLKPKAPAEFRGSFNPIASNLPGLEVGEHMPRIARVCDQLTLLRSVTHPDAGHESATHFLLTGYPPTNDIPSNEVPSYGSIVGKELGPKQPGLPPYVAVPRAPRSSAAAYLGVEHNPFEAMGDPGNDGFQVRNLAPPYGVSSARLEHRRSLLSRIDTIRRDADASGAIRGMDTFSQKVFEMVTSPKVRDAFAIDREDPRMRDRYGRHTWGQSTLLARRLVEAGVRFVTVDMGGWDTHGNNFESLKTGLLPKFDQAYSALIDDLRQRGRLDSTLVLVWGEFGRTPRINPGAGRDHWPNVFSVVLAGGGIKPGIVLGSSDALAEYPKDRPVSPQDVLSTMYHQLGVDQEKSYVNEANRPIQILNLGRPIPEII